MPVRRVVVGIFVVRRGAAPSWATPLLEVRTRGDVPMPRTGYWDIADFLAHGND